MNNEIDGIKIVEILGNHSDTFFEVLKKINRNQSGKLLKNLFQNIEDVFLLCNPTKNPEDFSKIMNVDLRGNDLESERKKLTNNLFGEFASDDLNSVAFMFYNATLMGCNAYIETSQSKKWCWLSEAHFFYGLGMGELFQKTQNVNLKKNLAIFLSINAKAVLSNQGKKAVIEKLKKDPRQKDKLLVNDCWLEWQKHPERYLSKAAFARDMLTKCEHLVSQKKIEDWCRAWQKGTNPAG